MKRLIGLIAVLAPLAAVANQSPGSDPFRSLQKEGVKFFARFSVVDDAAWKVLVKQQEGEDLLTVMDDRTARVLLSAPGNSERFLSAEAVQVGSRSEPFLVTRWTKGAHGQELRIYDPRTAAGKPLVYSKASSWTIDYQNANGRLKITGRADERPNSREGAFEVSWP
jgi:hypothetical protein